MKYLCNDMHYLMGLCKDKMQVYEKILNSLLREYRDEKETDVIALCVDIADVTQKHEYVESLYYQSRSNSKILVTVNTVLLLRTSKLFDWIKFISIEEEDDGSCM